MHQTEASQLSPGYSFRSTGEALRIYHADSVEQVTFDVGGTFTWSEDGKGHTLKLLEVKKGESLGPLPDGTPGPVATSGIYEFSVTTDGQTEYSTVEISV